jgi:hypothetical protein
MCVIWERCIGSSVVATVGLAVKGMNVRTKLERKIAKSAFVQRVVPLQLICSHFVYWQSLWKWV